VHHLANLGGCARDDAAPKAGFQARVHFTLPEPLARFRRMGDGRVSELIFPRDFVQRV
jgi:hypothetical protein